MIIKHHPSDETLARFASGALDEARSLVVATHLSLCPACRAAAQTFEAVGGSMLDALKPEPMSPNALTRTLARLDTGDGRGRPAEAPANLVEDLPAPLRGYELGPWRRIGRGVEWRSVNVPADRDMRVFMLRAEPGIRLPRHKHKGDEWTCVFAGAFRHQLGRYGPGDFDEADEAVEHHPVVEDGVPCVCLVALERGIALQGWMGRLIQPFIRI
jgi:putative transcriptional regulator